MPKSHSAIEWTDATWNPMTGCTELSRGCDNCYAARLAETKLRQTYLKRAPIKMLRIGEEAPFAPRFWPDRMNQPLRWRTPRRVFVNSMSDLFHAHFTVAMISEVFDVMLQASWHNFQILTKRPERAARLASGLPWPDNVWLGTSIEDMSVARRADSLRTIPAAVRFISAEPLLGSLHDLDLSGIHWLIGGGESGPGFRSPEESWAFELREKCAESNIAFFWKQWGGFTPKARGRLLDGREWNQYPPRRLSHRGVGVSCK